VNTNGQGLEDVLLRGRLPLLIICQVQQQYHESYPLFTLCDKLESNSDKRYTPTPILQLLFTAPIPSALYVTCGAIILINSHS